MTAVAERWSPCWSWPPSGPRSGSTRSRHARGSSVWPRSRRWIRADPSPGPGGRGTNASTEASVPRVPPLSPHVGRKKSREITENPVARLMPPSRLARAR